jgi:hypothetical protein
MTLEALQRRSSDIWVEYREQLAANPDAIAVPQAFIDNGWVRIAVGAGGAPIGFSVVIPSSGGAHYERLGFTVAGGAETRFGPAVRMSRELDG